MKKIFFQVLYVSKLRASLLEPFELTWSLGDQHEGDY